VGELRSRHHRHRDDRDTILADPSVDGTEAVGSQVAVDDDELAFSFEHGTESEQ